MNEVSIYTDGSCLGNPGPGGWACRIYKDSQERTPIELSGGYSHTTNNRMEILRALVCAHLFRLTVCLFSS